MIKYLLLLFATPALAQTNFANCDKLQEQMAQLKNPMPDQERLDVMNSVVNDLQKLTEESSNPNRQIPTGFINNCFKQKRIIIDSHVGVAPGSVKGMAMFSRIMGQYALILKNKEQALKAFLEASERDKKDYFSRKEAFHLWFQTQQQKIASQQNDTIRRGMLEKFAAEANNILQPMLDDKDSPINVKTQLLWTRANMYRILFKSESSALNDWKLILTYDPNHKEAALRTAAYEYARKNYPEARKYLIMASRLELKKASIHETLMEVLVNLKDFDGAVEHGKRLTPIFPKNASIRAGYAAGLAGQGLMDMAKTENAKALKYQPKNALARKTQGIILEKEGDEYLRKKLLGPALATYNESYKFNAKNNSLRQKMAALVYDFRKEQNFQPDGASKKDMNKIVELLSSVMNEQDIDKSSLHILISAATRSDGKQKQGSAACDFHRKEFGRLPSVQLYVDCAKCYAKSQRKDDASSLLQEGINDPRFSGGSQELNQALMGI